MSREYGLLFGPLMNILQRFVEIFRFGGDIRENCALGVVAVVSAKSTSTRTRTVQFDGLSLTLKEQSGKIKYSGVHLWIRTQRQFFLHFKKEVTSS